MCVSLRCFSTLSLTQLRRCYLSPPHSHTLQYVSQRGTSTAVRLKYCDLLSFDLQIEELSSQFAHVSCQSVGEAPPLYPSSQGYIYAAPPLHPPPPPPNPANYCQPSPQVRIHQRFISQVSS